MKLMKNLHFFRYFRGLAAILRKGLTVQEAIDIAFGEVDEINNCIEAVYIAPPDPATLTDEDSGDEDEGGNEYNLNRRQLLADAELRTARGITLEEEIFMDETQSQESEEELFEDGAPPINDINVSPAHIAYPKVSDPRDWISGDFTYNERNNIISGRRNK